MRERITTTHNHNWLLLISLSCIIFGSPKAGAKAQPGRAWHFQLRLLCVRALCWVRVRARARKRCAFEVRAAGADCELREMLVQFRDGVGRTTLP